MHPQGWHSMHVTNWGEAQGEDALVAACQKWMHTRKDVDSAQKGMHFLRDVWVNTLNQRRVKQCSTSRNSFTMKNGVLYVNTMPKGETEGLLAFVVPSAHWQAALNGVH